MFKIKKQISKLYMASILGNLSLTGAWVAILAARGYSLIKIGIAETVFHIFSLTFEIPSGVFADVFGRKQMLVVSSIMRVIGSICMICSKNLTMVCVAIACFAVSYNFSSGSGDALAYDSLKLVGEEVRYERYASNQLILYRLCNGISTLCAGFALFVGYKIAYASDILVTGIQIGVLLSLREIHLNHTGAERKQAVLQSVWKELRGCFVESLRFLKESKRKTYEDAKASIDKTLSDIGLDYLDMMIIHSPQPWVEVNQSDDRYVEGNRAAWKALEEAYKEGKLKAIGVSNFQIGDIESLLETCEIKPMVNQILLHISNTPLELVEYCQKKGIAVEAYSPIAHGEILHQPEIADMAEKYGVSVPQLCIRYTLQLGAISLPKTGNPEHMKTNADVDFEISAEDMEVLKNFKHIESYGESSGFPVYGGKL